MGKSAADVVGATYEELMPIIKDIRDDIDGMSNGDVIIRIAEEDRLTEKQKIMTAHFIGKMTV